MQLERYKQGWEDIGKLDPLWAVLTEPSGQYGRWDQGSILPHRGGRDWQSDGRGGQARLPKAEGSGS